jgi:hypothetical protein
VAYELCTVHDIPSPYLRHIEGCQLQGKTKERWLELCEQAADEQEPGKLLELISEINRLLQEKEDHLKRRSNSGDAA